MTSPDDAGEAAAASDTSAAFRRNSTRGYRAFVVLLTAVAIGLAVLGWWLGGWWGLAGGVVAGVVVFAGGVIAGTLIWAMTQDGA